MPNPKQKSKLDHLTKKEIHSQQSLLQKRSPDGQYFALLSQRRDLLTLINNKTDTVTKHKFEKRIHSFDFNCNSTILAIACEDLIHILYFKAGKTSTLSLAMRNKQRIPIWVKFSSTKGDILIIGALAQQQDVQKFYVIGSKISVLSSGAHKLAKEHFLIPIRPSEYLPIEEAQLKCTKNETKIFLPKFDTNSRQGTLLIARLDHQKLKLIYENKETINQKTFPTHCMPDRLIKILGFTNKWIVAKGKNKISFQYNVNPSHIVYTMSLESNERVTRYMVPPIACCKSVRGMPLLRRAKPDGITHDLKYARGKLYIITKQGNSLNPVTVASQNESKTVRKYYNYTHPDRSFHSTRSKYILGNHCNCFLELCIDQGEDLGTYKISRIVIRDIENAHFIYSHEINRLPDTENIDLQHSILIDKIYFTNKIFITPSRSGLKIHRIPTRKIETIRNLSSWKRLVFDVHPRYENLLLTALGRMIQIWDLNNIHRPLKTLMQSSPITGIKWSFDELSFCALRGYGSTIGIWKADRRDLDDLNERRAVMDFHGNNFSYYELNIQPGMGRSEINLDNYKKFTVPNSLLYYNQRKT